MNYSPEVIAQVENDIAANLGVTYRFDGTQWQSERDGQLSPVSADNAAGFMAMLADVQEAYDAGRLRAIRRTRRRSSAPGPNVPTAAMPGADLRAPRDTQQQPARADAVPVAASLVAPPQSAGNAPPIQQVIAQAVAQGVASAPTTTASPSSPIGPPPATSAPPVTPGQGPGRWYVAGRGFIPNADGPNTPGARWVPFNQPAGAPAGNAPVATPTGAPPTPPSGPNILTQSAGIMRGQVGRYFGDLMPTLTVGAALYGAHQTGANLERGARGLIDGAGDAVGSAYRVGADIANSLLDAVAEPFGASGRAVATLGRKITDSLGGAIDGAFGVVGGVVGAGGRIAGTVAGLGLGLVGAGAGAVAGAGVGTLTGAAGAGIGALGGAVAGPGGVAAGMGAGAITGAAGAILPGAMIGGLVGVSVGAAISKGVGDVGESIGGVFRGLGKVIETTGGIATTAFKSAHDIAKDLADTVDRWGTRVAQIEAQTGLSTNAAAATSLRFNALGLGGTLGNLGGIENNPQLFAMRARAFGLSSFDSADFLPSAAERFQTLRAQGLTGQLRAQMMAQTLGMGDAASQRALLIAPERLQRQQQDVSGFAGALGLSPARLREAADGVYLFTNKVSSLVELLKLKALDSAIAYFGPRIEGLTRYITNNADKISSGIKAGVAWIFEEMPQLLMRGAAFGLRALGSLSGAFARFAEASVTYIPGILKGIDGLLGGMRTLAVGAVALTAGGVQTARNLGIVPDNSPQGQAQAAQRAEQEQNTIDTGRRIGGLSGAAAGALRGLMMARGVASRFNNPWLIGGTLAAGAVAGGYAGYRGGEYVGGQTGGALNYRDRFFGSGDAMPGTIQNSIGGGLRISALTADSRGPQRAGLLDWFTNGSQMRELGKQSRERGDAEQSRRVAQIEAQRPYSKPAASFGDLIAPNGNVSPLQRMGDAWRQADATLPRLTVSQYSDSLTGMAGKFGEGAKTAEKWFEDKAATLEGGADKWKDILSELKKFNEHAAAIRGNTAEGAKAAAVTANNVVGAMQDTAARVAANIVEDASLRLVGG